MKDRRSEVRFHPAVLATVVIGLILCVALGYHHGVTAWEREYAAAHEKQKKHERDITRLADDCLTRYDAASHNISLRDHNTTIHAMVVSNREIEAQIAQDADTYESLYAAEAKCRAALAALQAKDAAAGEGLREAVEEAAEDVRVLRASLHRLTDGDGMHGALTRESIEALRRTYRQLCGRTPGCTVLGSESLLRKWEKAIGSIPFTRWNAESRSSRRMLWIYNPNDPRNADIFLPSEEEEEERWPTYFDREGNAMELVGNTPEEPPLVRGSVLQRVETVHHFALCAYRRRNANFTLPSTFYWREAGGRTTSLRQLIQTPLLTFCRNCTSMEASSEFWIACQDAAGEGREYGKHDYWAMRSMVRPHPRLVHDAKRFYETHALTDRKVLAVVVRNAVADCHALRERPRGEHFLYLAANFPEAAARFARDGGNDTLFECAPTAQQTAARIDAVMEEQRRETREGFDAIYLSAPSAFREELHEVAGQSEWWDTVLFRGTAETDGAADELADLVAAGMASAVLVSAFMAPSQYVVEEFLLRHKLHPSGRIWVF